MIILLVLTIMVDYPIYDILEVLVVGDFVVWLLLSEDDDDELVSS